MLSRKNKIDSNKAKRITNPNEKLKIYGNIKDKIEVRALRPLIKGI
mgnify:CR=1 FL=1